MSTIPTKGQRVMFGHLLLDGEHEGVVVDVSRGYTRTLCDVDVGGNVVAGCLWSDEKPTIIRGQEWQYCYPVE